MYHLNLATATTDDVITRSIVEAMTFGQMIAAFGAAMRLQSIPLGTGMDIIERTTTKAAG
jgi:hypothetical protein